MRKKKTKKEKKKRVSDNTHTHTHTHTHTCNVLFLKYGITKTIIKIKQFIKIIELKY